MTTATATQTVQKLSVPTQWKAVMLDDDTTPQEFVVLVLQEVFDKTEDEAIQQMQQIHNNGRAVVYVSTLEIVRQKVDDCNKLSKTYGFDLKVIKEQA